MSRTITAMFDSREDAEAGKQSLLAANVDADNVRIHDQSSQGFRAEGDYSSHEDRGIWESIKNAFLPDEDRHTYEEGVRRGGVVLTADVDENEVDDAMRALDDANSVDVDERAEQWRSQGWDYAAATPADTGMSGDMGANERPAMPMTSMDDRNPAMARGMDADRDTGMDERIPIVEERLTVGKREVDRGGVHIRSYVTETPVHEQVRLRNERIDVERRAVDLPLSEADGDAFRERTIDMTAHGEEAVIGKDARVVEELLVHKTSDERTEDVEDSVRRTEVDVDRDMDDGRSAMGTDRDMDDGTGLIGTDRNRDGI